MKDMVKLTCKINDTQMDNAERLCVEKGQREMNAFKLNLPLSKFRTTKDTQRQATRSESRDGCMMMAIVFVCADFWVGFGVFVYAECVVHYLHAHFSGLRLLQNLNIATKRFAVLLRLNAFALNYVCIGWHHNLQTLIVIKCDAFPAKNFQFPNRKKPHRINHSPWRHNYELH